MDDTEPRGHAGGAGDDATAVGMNHDGDELTEDFAAPESLDQNKALVLAAVTAIAWHSRDEKDAPGGKALVKQLMLAASWVSRARRNAGKRALDMSELVDAFKEPVADWLPGGDSFALIQDGVPTPQCLDIADEFGSSPLEEVEQKVIKVAMEHLAERKARKDAASIYTEFRRFLVEHAYARRTEAIAALQKVGVNPSDAYEHIPESVKVLRGGEQRFYPCPRCGWPMKPHENQLSCYRSMACFAAGARFDFTDGKIVALGNLAPPKPVSAEGNVALRPGIWRFTVLPGLEELALANKMAAIKGAQVALWPFMDAYDLDVRRGGHHWRIDVKNYSVASTLARHLNAHPSDKRIWIVIPDAKKAQVPVLRRWVLPEVGYDFASVSEMIRRVEGLA